MSVNKNQPAEQDAWLRLRCPEKLVRAVEKHIKRTGGTLSGFVRTAVSEKLAAEGGSKQQKAAA
jgi:hypothetical protein